MNRTATQHAGIAAESVDGLNQCLRAALADADEPGLAGLKDAFETVASLKLLAQRLTLAATQTQQLVSKWHEEDHLHSGAVDTGEAVASFGTAMTEASTAARALFIALDDATRGKLGLVGWQEPAPPAASPAAS